MNIGSIMKTNVATVTPTDLLTTAAQVMLWSGGRHLLVVEHGRVVGVLSEGDLFRARAGDMALHLELVRQAMSAPVQSLTSDDSIASAAGFMARKKIGCLPIIDQGKLVGIISTTDVLEVMERETTRGVPKTGDEQVETEMSSLRALRDRLRLKARLGGMDMRDAWRELQAEVAQAERIARGAGSNALTFIRRVRERAEHAYQELIHEAQRDFDAIARRAHRDLTEPAKRRAPAPRTK